MQPRPISVTIICWFLIITSGISLAPGALSYNNPAVMEIMKQSVLPIVVQYIFMIVSAAITLLSGVLMLKGKVKGRLIYVVWSIISLVIGTSVSPAKAMMIPGVVLFIIFVILLFRPKANAFFGITPKEPLSDS